MAVRTDPQNIRGPAPPGGRKPIPRRGSVPAISTLFKLSPIEVYEALWESALLAAINAITLLEGFSRIKMPGGDPEELIRLRKRLENITRENDK